MDEALIEKCDRIAYASRVTYLEANLMRQFRKTTTAQAEANAIWEYLAKYDEVSRDDVMPWLRSQTVDLLRKYTPETKNQATGKLDKVKHVPWLQ